MTPTDQAILRAIGLSARRFADILSKPPSTVHGWGHVRNGRLQETPTEIRLLLSAWEQCPALVPKTKPHAGNSRDGI